MRSGPLWANQKYLAEAQPANRAPAVIAFHEAHPERAGARIILQDTEQVLGSASVPSSIEKMPHDFFREQPVKGARAYYFHRVVRAVHWHRFITLHPPPFPSPLLAQTGVSV